MQTIARLLGVVWMVSCTASVAVGGPLENLAGHWSGWGVLSTTSGTNEQMKCVTTYQIADDGNSARQSFRCASSSYRFDARISYKVSVGQVSGTWRERLYSAGGTLSGQLTRAGLSAKFNSDTISGQISITTTGCRQTIEIRPSMIEIARMSVKVSNC
ncbi:MAG: hypothetical protein ACR2PG_13515 [Hyphomicrobiaceae bacterium]